MNRKQLMRRLALGTVAGMAGTCAVQGLRMASQKWLPETMPTFRKEPGMFMLEKAEDLLPPPVSGQVPRQVKTAAARVLGLGYGSAFGAFYATLDSGGRSTVVDGIALGFMTWATGYLGWLPALGLMRPVRQQSFGEAVGPLLRHICFGVVTVSAYRRLTAGRTA